jgi:undecaprenyl-diphosphatase
MAGLVSTHTSPRPPAGATAAVGQAAEAAASATSAAARATVRAAAAETLPTRPALARGRGAMALATAGLLGFLGIFGLVQTKRSEAVDLAILLRVQRTRHPLLSRVIAAASWPGFPPQSRLITPAAIGGLWLLKFRVEAVFHVLAWGTALLSTVIKAAMRRPRPLAGTDLRVVAAPLGGSSFPSGHVITYMGIYGFLAYLAHTLLRPRAARRAIVAGLVGLLALVGPSRIHQGHHWPTDVTASYLLGSSYLVVLIALYRRVKGGLGPREDVDRRHPA